MTRKSLPGHGKRKGNDDSEDEFRPTKAAGKAKKPTEAKKPRAKPPAKIDDDDDDDELLPAPKKRAPVTERKDEKDEWESDFEAVERPAVKAAKAKVVKVDSDSEVEMIPAPPAKGKGKTSEVPKRKR